MPDFLVTCISGTWSVNVWEGNQTDATIAGNAALTNVQKKLPTATLGDIWQYQAYPSGNVPGGNSVDYLVTVTASGSWSMTIYVENQTSTTAASTTALNNLTQVISGTKASTTQKFTPTAQQAQLVQVT